MTEPREPQAPNVLSVSRELWSALRRDRGVDMGFRGSLSREAVRSPKGQELLRQVIQSAEERSKPKAITYQQLRLPNF